MHSRAQVQEHPIWAGSWLRCWVCSGAGLQDQAFRVRQGKRMGKAQGVDLHCWRVRSQDVCCMTVCGNHGTPHLHHLCDARCVHDAKGAKGDLLTTMHSQQSSSFETHDSETEGAHSHPLLIRPPQPLTLVHTCMRQACAPVSNPKP